MGQLCRKNFLTAHGTHSPPSELVTFVLPWCPVHAPSPRQLVVLTGEAPPSHHTSEAVLRGLCAPGMTGSPPPWLLTSLARESVRAGRLGLSPSCGGTGRASTQNWSSALPPPRRLLGGAETLAGGMPGRVGVCGRRRLTGRQDGTGKPMRLSALARYRFSLLAGANLCIFPPSHLGSNYAFKS